MDMQHAQELQRELKKEVHNLSVQAEHIVNSVSNLRSLLELIANQIGPQDVKEDKKPDMGNPEKERKPDIGNERKKNKSTVPIANPDADFAPNEATMMVNATPTVKALLYELGYDLKKAESDQLEVLRMLARFHLANACSFDKANALIKAACFDFRQEAKRGL